MVDAGVRLEALAHSSARLLTAPREALHLTRSKAVWSELASIVFVLVVTFATATNYLRGIPGLRSFYAWGFGPAVNVCPRAWVR